MGQEHHHSRILPRGSEEAVLPTALPLHHREGSRAAVCVDQHRPGVTRAALRAPVRCHSASGAAPGPDGDAGADNDESSRYPEHRQAAVRRDDKKGHAVFANGGGRKRLLLAASMTKPWTLIPQREHFNGPELLSPAWTLRKGAKIADC